MKNAEWTSEDVRLPRHIPTMISPEEKQYLHWLGSSAWQGKGLVVEIGPWLGGSTWCLAAGMRSSGHPTSKQLVVYDNFVWREFMSERAHLDLRPGDCFQDEFLKNVREFSSVIDSYKQTLPDETIDSDSDAQSKRYAENEDVELFRGAPGSDPVEILFVDGAKSWLGLKHLMVNVSERLKPGCSLIVCQDYKYWGNYWVPLMMTILADYIQAVHNVMSATTVTFRLTRPLPRGLLESLPNHISDMATNDALESIDGACDLLRAGGDAAGSANVALGKVMLLCHQGKRGLAVSAFRESQLSWPRRAGTAQLERARQYLAESQNTRVSSTLKIRAWHRASQASNFAGQIAQKIKNIRRRG